MNIWFNYTKECRVTFKLSHPDAIAEAITIKDQKLIINTSDVSLDGIHNITIASFTPSGSPGSILSFNLTMVDACMIRAFDNA